MPAATPTCRAVLLTPEPTPAFSSSTVPIAADASGGLVSPEPAPATMKPASSTVQPELGSTSVMSASPTATRVSPGPSNSLSGRRSDSRPASGATSNTASVRGQEPQSGLERGVGEDVLQIQ